MGRNPTAGAAYEVFTDWRPNKGKSASIPAWGDCKQWYDDDNLHHVLHLMKHMPGNLFRRVKWHTSPHSRDELVWVDSNCMACILDWHEGFYMLNVLDWWRV